MDIPVSIPTWTPPTLTNLYLLTEGMSPLELDVPRPQTFPPSSFSGNSHGFGVRLQAYLSTRWIGARRSFGESVRVWMIDIRSQPGLLVDQFPHPGSLNRLPLSLLSREEGAVDIAEVPGDQEQSMDSKQQILLTLPHNGWKKVILRLTYMLNRPVELPARKTAGMGASLDLVSLCSFKPVDSSVVYGSSSAYTCAYCASRASSRTPPPSSSSCSSGASIIPSFFLQSRSSLTLYDHVPL
ncbi:hypothetical protein BT96DRAFT_948306 [Gymnopus androsaceus JB14]|uniref:Uncharacterized protein n=1 Tax=Gymnopus androsaceus JB14 TaxID=1447944 RepID=A0A6A4GQJ7_9AGAR|nr:hypothetical protein BT96DRAFT_948306 [Gymnopus androsaceus JB14]